MTSHDKAELADGKDALDRLRTLRAEMLDFDDGNRPMANTPKERRAQREREYAMVDLAIGAAQTDRTVRQELLAAVRHVLQRVCRDANFRHYMLFTETLKRCTGAFVLATGEEVVDQVRDADPGEADVVRLRREAGDTPGDAEAMRALRAFLQSEGFAHETPTGEHPPRPHEVQTIVEELMHDAGRYHEILLDALSRGEVVEPEVADMLNCALAESEEDGRG